MSENTPLTHEEIEKMRAIVQQHDATTKGGEFDLNNPPKAPYVHQAFPKIVYEHNKRKFKTVHNAQQLAAAIEDGFLTEPYPPEEESAPVHLDAASTREAAAMDAQIAAANAKAAAKAKGK